jgi:hypothetical protein
MNPYGPSTAMQRMHQQPHVCLFVHASCTLAQIIDPHMPPWHQRPAYVGNGGGGGNGEYVPVNRRQPLIATTPPVSYGVPPPHYAYEQQQYGGYGSAPTSQAPMRQQ